MISDVVIVVIVCTKFVELLFTCSSKCSIIGTLFHNAYNRVLEEISILL